MIRESIVKACEGNISKWPLVAPYTFWADRATTRKSTGHSPFYMAYIEPVLPHQHNPFHIPRSSSQTTHKLSTADLIATRARQLPPPPPPPPPPRCPSSPSSRAQMPCAVFDAAPPRPRNLKRCTPRSGSWFRPLENQNRTILNRTNGPVLGSPKSENRTNGPVLSSQKYLEEPDRTEPYHPYSEMQNTGNTD
jgi:hypothetical protein